MAPHSRKNPSRACYTENNKRASFHDYSPQQSGLRINLMFWRKILLITGINNILYKAGKSRVIDLGFHVNTVWLIKAIASHFGCNYILCLYLKNDASLLYSDPVGKFLYA
jgi:hypothetical protein